MKELVVTIRVAATRDRFAATAELGGMPICSYGATSDEASRRAQGTAMRFLGGIVERGEAELEAIRFKVLEV